MQSAPKTYFPNLDATRFFAFIPVFFTHVFFSQNPAVLNSETYHFVETHLKVGILGLDYFFVLSSFLITWIILEEYQLAGEFNFKNFVLRRSLRIWPLYFLIVGVGFIAAQFFTTAQLPPLPYFLLFILNFYIVQQGDAFLFFLVILWSVSVEEQFYFCWAIMLKFLKKYLLPFCFILIGISLLFRWMNLTDQKKLYFHTASTLANFSIGALVAYLSFYRTKAFHFLKTLPKIQIFSIYFLMFLNIIFYKSIYCTSLLQTFERLIFSLFFGFIIFEQSFCTESIFRFGKWKWSNYLGNASFGLYCYHGVIITIFIKLSEHYGWSFSAFQIFILNPLLLLALTIAVTIASYEIYERKFLILKDKFRSKPIPVK